MKIFDCLSPSYPLLGPHLLEASAGTGKTFAIEHIFTRLLLESSLQIEEILVVTFTRAATRELKGRIRANLEKACRKESSPSLQTALSLFDRCQIFTIHGFCYRALQEFAFEANLSFSLPHPDLSRDVIRDWKHWRKSFLQTGIPPEAVCPEQLSILLSQYETSEGISRAIEKGNEKKACSWTELAQEFETLLKPKLPLTESDLLADFALSRENYKVKKGDFPPQLKALAAVDFPTLIAHQGTLFDYFLPENQKIRTKLVTLRYPGFLEWAAETLGPLVKTAADSETILGTLKNAWNQWKQEHIPSNAAFDPDDLINQMRRAVEIPAFATRLRSKIKAVIIDEFQDTDPLQWEIFRKLFLESSTPLQALYLVGDPKQSIYRFRGADVYTYIAAKNLLGKENLYHLNTNFRSSQTLNDALNILFHRPWLHLPQLDETLTYHPVATGSNLSSQFSDCKAALHWIIGEENASFEETFLPYAVAEIERLSLTQAAILVKDRYEAQKALDLLKKRAIPAVAISHQSIGQTETFRDIREFLQAIASPYDESLQKIVDLGPFASSPPLPFLKELLQNKGLAALLREVFSFFTSRDAKQIAEELLDWELREGFSFEGLDRFLQELEYLPAEEGGRRWMEENTEAVQILTLHISKGLEFDVVFALGLASPPSRQETNDPEFKAEKLRQLYVAMTRAKRRLYVPYKKGASPIALFAQQIETQEGPFLSYLEKLSSHTIEHLSTPFSLPQKTSSTPPLSPPFLPHPLPFTPSYLNSFTSLARPKPRKEPLPPLSEQEIPRSPATGTFFHHIFEILFSSTDPLASVDRIVEQEACSTSFAPWTKPIQELIRQTLLLPLSDGTQTFSLHKLSPENCFVEMEFLYPSQNDFIKGFIDLVFRIDNKIYFLDWKTNWLKDTSLPTLQEEMEMHDYPLQAALYAEAMRRFAPALEFGGAFYIFVRYGTYLYIKDSHGS